ncbi:MAG TPA: HEPN domain-containing protein [Bacillota bacterium]|nr:HEPN domain-containing protein [Bacillota bacterium]
MSEEQLQEAVKYWWEKAEESLASAELELKSGSKDFAVNRLYYAVFYAVSAALLERQIVFKRHTGVRAAFHQEFIKTGLLDFEWGKYYDQLFEDRQEGDYVAFFAFEEGYIKSQLELCNKFLFQLKPLISSLK